MSRSPSPEFDAHSTDLFDDGIPPYSMSKSGRLLKLVKKMEWPVSYLSNTPKEDLCLEYVEHFRSQYVQLFPSRAPLMLSPANECGVKKFICTFLRATQLQYADMYDYNTCATYLAHYITYEELEDPEKLPSVVASPTTTLAWQAGDCFDMSVLLASLVLGAGYDAYCVIGYASLEVTTNDQSSRSSPEAVPDESGEYHPGPFAAASWWHCLVPCATLWMGLESAMCCLNMHAMVERRHCPATAFRYLHAFATYGVGAGTMCVVWFVIAVSAPALSPFYFHGALAAIISSVVMNLASPFLCVSRATLRSAAGHADALLALLFNMTFLVNDLMYWGAAALFLFAASYSDGAAVATTTSFISCRICGVFINDQLIHRMSKPDDSTAAMGVLMVDTNHCSFLIVVLGQSSVAVTVMVMLFDLVWTVTTLPFIAGWIKVPWHQLLANPLRRWWGKPPVVLTEDQRAAEAHHAIIHTVIGELTEVLIILAYTPLYLICRAGRNTQWMAGIGANIWNYSTPTVLSYVTNMLIALAVELLSALLNYCLLRRYANVSLFEMAAHVARYWGPNICATYAFVLYHQMCITIVHCGMDLTFHEHGTWLKSYSFTPWD